MARPFREENAEFEAWLRTQCDVVDVDLEYKHQKMTKSAFVFLRATYFRWASRIEQLCPEVSSAPAVLSIGDAHIENFGTWRDAEGRLVWGINDFDEAAEMAYPLDLVRLATSLSLSPDATVSGADAAGAILQGYRIGLTSPRPTLLDEQETWMRPYVACTDADRLKFWDEVDGYPAATPPATVAAALEHSLPESASVRRFASRVKGGGSLGRPRFLAISDWRGGRIVREAKALVPSAWTWAHGTSTQVTRFLDLANGTYRSPDPHLLLKDGFILRRIAADSRKVTLGGDAHKDLPARLLRAMGRDIGSIHAASGRAADILKDLDDRSDKPWLRAAAKVAAAAVEDDYAEWIAS